MGQQSAEILRIRFEEEKRRRHERRGEQRESAESCPIGGAGSGLSKPRPEERPLGGKPPVRPAQDDVAARAAVLIRAGGRRLRDREVKAVS